MFYQSPHKCQHVFTLYMESIERSSSEACSIDDLLSSSSPALCWQIIGVSHAYIHKKTWSRSVARSTLQRLSHCPICRNEQRRKPHAESVYKTACHIYRCRYSNAYINVPWGVPVALFFDKLTLNLRDSRSVKNQSVQ